MKRNISLTAAAVFTACLAMAQTKKPKNPPPPPPPPVIDVKHIPPPPPPPPLPDDYKAFLDRNPGVKNLSWFKQGHAIGIYRTSGKTETYHLDKKEERQELQQKYGDLPDAPPPPPPPIIKCKTEI